MHMGTTSPAAPGRSLLTPHLWHTRRKDEDQEEKADIAPWSSAANTFVHQNVLIYVWVMHLMAAVGENSTGGH